MIDARDRVLGRTSRTADVRLPGMLEAALVRSAVPSGRIIGVDTDAALRSPGVVAVVTGNDVAAAGLEEIEFGTIIQDQPILALDRVRHVGEPIAVVLAERRADAERGAALVVPHIDVTPALLDMADALADGAALVHPGRPHNVIARWAFSQGAIDAARRTAAHHFAGRWTSPAAQVVSLETHAVVAHWPTPDRLELWSTTQSPSRTAIELGRILGLTADAVRLHVPPLGGAFGGKNHAKLEPLVAFASRVAGRPVRHVNRREDEFVTITKHAASVEIESGTDAEGRFVYRTARIVADGGAYANSSSVIPKASGGAVLGPYRVPAASVDAVVVYTNHPPAGSFRGLGVSQVAWASEQQVDEIAVELGIDPRELRHRNLVRDGDRLPNGDLAAHPHWDACLDAATGGWSGGVDGDWRTPRIHADDPPWVRRGRGVAVTMKATMAPSRTDVELAATSSGRIIVRTSAVEMGQGARSAIRILAREAMGVDVDRVDVVDPDTAVTPFDATTSSSRTTVQHHHAIERAARALRERLETLARDLPTPAVDPVCAEGRVRDPATGLDIGFGDLMAAVGTTQVAASASYVNEPPRDPETGLTGLTSDWHQGAVAVEVAVDVETGCVRVSDVRGAAWAGRVVDPVAARLQNEGNVVFGMGPSLFEDLALADGHPRSTSLRDYRIPAIGDLPERLVTVALEGEDGEPAGLGESLIPAVAPAVGNALAAALGIRLRDLPMTPERVLQALDDRIGRAGRDERS